MAILPTVPAIATNPDKRDPPPLRSLKNALRGHLEISGSNGRRPRGPVGIREPIEKSDGGKLFCSHRRLCGFPKFAYRYRHAKQLGTDAGSLSSENSEREEKRRHNRIRKAPANRLPTVLGSDPKELLTGEGERARHQTRQTLGEIRNGQQTAAEAAPAAL